MNRYYYTYVIAFLLCLSFRVNASDKDKDGNLLLRIMHQQPDLYDSILKYKERYRLQILYTKVDRDGGNQPVLTTYVLDTGKYFYYCASMIKLMEIPLAIEKINNIPKNYGVTIYDSLYVSGDPCGDASEAAYRKRPNFSTPAQFIKEMLLVSNNHAFNPLYDLLTQQYFNRRAHELGYASVVITNRFASCDSFQNRVSPTVNFYDRATGALKYIQPAYVNPNQPRVTGFNTVVGTGFMNNGQMGPPKDFAYSNYMSLGDAHRLLTHLIFPQLQPKKHRLNLTKDDYALIHKYMGMYPRESAQPVYEAGQNPDNKMKFFVTLSDTIHAPTNFRVYNKVGQAYGFVNDCSYVADTANDLEFFLSVSMYVNKDEVLNDDAYEYESIAMPFLRNLFYSIYEYELNRRRKHTPKFEKWDFQDNNP